MYSRYKETSAKEPEDNDVIRGPFEAAAAAILDADLGGWKPEEFRPEEATVPMRSKGTVVQVWDTHFVIRLYLWHVFLHGT